MALDNVVGKLIRATLGLTMLGAVAYGARTPSNVQAQNPTPKPAVTATATTNQKQAAAQTGYSPDAFMTWPLKIQNVQGASMYISGHYDHESGPGFRDHLERTDGVDGHTGTDFSCSDRNLCDVVAVADGTITGIARQSIGYDVVQRTQINGTTYIVSYSDLSEPLVTTGPIGRGTVIAKYAPDRNHTHIELRKDNGFTILGIYYHISEPVTTTNTSFWKNNRGEANCPVQFSDLSGACIIDTYVVGENPTPTQTPGVPIPTQVPGLPRLYVPIGPKNLVTISDNNVISAQERFQRK